MGTTMLGKGRQAISMILDKESFTEGMIDDYAHARDRTGEP